MLNPDGRAYWLRTRTAQPVGHLLGLPVDRGIDRYTGVLDAEDFPGVRVYQGRGVGGPSVSSRPICGVLGRGPA
ncbi:hypothetical protein [Microbispora sp. KK1-11]|uniref:hypothetical protein n=1 Tax=Microbispora sp. KK1-11 TaxID=2053005 RepID=UPI001C8D2F48|nr:hypothetical protein [Microbispora sp. KK1-11]